MTPRKWCLLDTTELMYTECEFTEATVACIRPTQVPARVPDLRRGSGYRIPAPTKEPSLLYPLAKGASVFSNTFLLDTLTNREQNSCFVFEFYELY